MAFGAKIRNTNQILLLSRSRIQREKRLVQETARNISKRFADVTDFETVADLEIALKRAKREVYTLNPLLQEFHPNG